MRRKPKGSPFNYHRGFIKAKTSQFWREGTAWVMHASSAAYRDICRGKLRLSLSRSPSLPVLIFLPDTHPKTSYRRLPRGALARQRDPVCHLIKRPTQTDGFVQTAPDALKAGTGSPPRQIRRRNAHLPLRWKPNRRKHINIELHHCWCETVRL